MASPMAPSRLCPLARWRPAVTSLVDQIQAVLATNANGISRSTLSERVTGHADPELQGVIEAIMLLQGGFRMEGDLWYGQSHSSSTRVLSLLDRYVAEKGAPIFRLSEALKELDPGEYLTADQLQELVSRERPCYRLLPNGMVRYIKD